MKVYRITIDEENNAEEFWTHEAHDLCDKFERDCFKQHLNSLYFLTKEEAENALNTFKTLPHWSDEGYPEYAPHPFIDDIYEEEFFDLHKMAEKLTDDYIKAFNYLQKVAMTDEDRLGNFYNWRVLIDEDGDFITDSDDNGSCILCADIIINKEKYGDYVEVACDEHPFDPEFLVKDDTPEDFLENHRDDVYLWAKHKIEDAIEEWEKQAFEFNEILKIVNKEFNN